MKKRLTILAILTLLVYSFSPLLATEYTPCSCPRYPDTSTMLQYQYNVGLNEGCCSGTVVGSGSVSAYVLNEGQWQFESVTQMKASDAQSICCN
jgi:hypothetical protein